MDSLLFPITLTGFHGDAMDRPIAVFISAGYFPSAETRGWSFVVSLLHSTPCRFLIGIDAKEEAGILKAGGYLMWFYRSPFGTFKVAQIGYGFCLFVDSEHLRDFANAEEAFAAVRGSRTGFKPWDERHPQGGDTPITWTRTLN